MSEELSSLGEKLKDARAIKHWSLAEAETQTKVRQEYLAAIEDGQYDTLPPDVFAMGFVRRYARTLGLNPNAAVALFREERAARRSGRKESWQFTPVKKLGRPRIVLSTRLLVSAGIALTVLLLFGYIWYQVRLFAAPPQLLVTSPAQETIMTQETVLIAGKTSPAASLFINGEPLLLDEFGTFQQDVRLAPGVNTIEIKAVNRLGKETVQTIHVLSEEESGS